MSRLAGLFCSPSSHPPPLSSTPHTPPTTTHPTTTHPTPPTHPPQLLESTEEEVLVCMCKLMTTIGHKLESYDQRKKKGVLMKEYFSKIGALSDDHPSSRMR